MDTGGVRTVGTGIFEFQKSPDKLQKRFPGGRHGRWHQGGSTPFQVGLYRRFKGLGRCVHKVSATAAVDMHIHKAGEQIVTLQVYHLTDFR